MASMGLKPILVPMASLDDGINAVRRTLPLCVFHPRTELGGIDALEQYRREYDDDKKAFRASAVHDWCFTGETKVLTRYGMYPIKELPNKGEVLTPCGWKPYHSPRLTRRNARVVAVEFADGLTVRCTPDHMFMTVNGWKSAEYLTRDMLIQSCLTHSHNISMVVSTACGRAKRISLAAVKSFIETLGAGHLVPSLVGATSITRMEIQPTIYSPILSAFQQANISRLHGKTDEKSGLLRAISRRPPETQHPIGTSLMRDAYGIGDMPNAPRVGLNGNGKIGPAIIAALSSMLLSAKAVIARGFATLNARSLHIVSVETLNEHQDVYCITVPGQESFSLANGAVVHNCSHPADAFRYLAMSYRPAPRIVAKEPKQIGWVIPPPRDQRHRGEIIL
jgi:hypothetical protein